MTKRAVFVGRWSPFHNGHLAIMQKKIDEGKPLLILIRDTHYDLYPPLLRKRMIEAAMSKLKVDAKVMVIDDIESVNWGRGVGYEVNEIEVPDDVKKISATEIREKIEAGDSSWKKSMPDGAGKVLSDYLLNHGFVVWFTGLPKAGKSSIAKLVAYNLEEQGTRAELLDGSILRKTISRDLGFSKEDRTKNLERAVFISKMLAKNGGIVLSTFITPYESQRKDIRKELEENGSFVEVFVKASVERCRERDKDGMYEKADKGEIEGFTGISAEFEPPKDADVTVDTDKESFEECAKKVSAYISNML